VAIFFVVYVVLHCISASNSFIFVVIGPQFSIGRWQQLWPDNAACHGETHDECSGTVIQLQGQRRQEELCRIASEGRCVWSVIHFLLIFAD